MRGGRKRALIIAAAVSLVLAIAAAFYSYRTQTVWIASAPYQRVSQEPARTLVVVYSRTGNTLGAAKEAARFFDRLTAPSPR